VYSDSKRETLRSKVSKREAGSSAWQGLLRVAQDARINPHALSQLSIAVAPDSVESIAISGTWTSTQGLMAVPQATSDQKGKGERDVGNGKEAKRLASFLLPFS
jgi:hypothetical protein